MPQTSPTPPATQQVERIREIIVGRQFHALEQRLSRLEESLQATPFGDHPVDPSILRTQKDQALELQRIQKSFDAEKARQSEETRRLAQQIQAVARSRREAAEETRRAVQADLRPWFHDWQGRLQQHLAQRENHLISELRAELEQMKHWIREELANSAQNESEPLRVALEQFATAARAVADHLPPSHS